MINETSQLNEIVRKISKDNTNSSISQLASVIEVCKNMGIKFSIDKKYTELLNVFVALSYPDFNLNSANEKIDKLARENKYQEAASLRDQVTASTKEINRQFRKNQYNTEDWFIPRSEKEIFFLPTQIGIVDSLIFA